MQTGQQDTRENVLLELVVQLAAEPAFNQLRTTEQLGMHKCLFLHSFNRKFSFTSFPCHIWSAVVILGLRRNDSFKSENCYVHNRGFSGYIVHTGARRSNGVQGIEILIQGQQIPEFMEERIENFLMKFRVSILFYY